MANPNTTPIRVIEETSGYWRAVFDYPPFNVVDGDVFQALQDLLVRMEVTETLRVVVFESALPDFYLSHFDLTGNLGNVMTGLGPSGFPILMDTFVRLTKSPVVSLAKIRGCVRGVSSEFVLACDMRFASRENTKLGHPELGVGLHPGGGGTERLPPGASEMKWSPISSTLILGKRDAVLVDTAITVDQNEKLVDWIAARGKNLTTIYATHGHGDHFFGVNTIQKKFPNARFVATREVIAIMKQQA